MKQTYEEICERYANNLFAGKSCGHAVLSYQNLEFASKIYDFFGSENADVVRKNAADMLKTLERENYTEREILSARAAGKRDAKKAIENYSRNAE